MRPDPFRLARWLAGKLIESPIVVIGGTVVILWGGSCLMKADWRTSHPRTLPDAVVARHFPTVSRGLYGTKYTKINDSTAGRIMNPPGVREDSRITLKIVSHSK